MSTLAVTIEKALPSDARAEFEILYHPEINESVASGNRNQVSFEEHDQWFQDRYFTSGDNHCFVLKAAAGIVGYCRFDGEASGSYKISLAIHPRHQGQGLGSRLLAAALEKMGSGKKYTAVIHQSNATSLALFKKFGFTVQSVANGYTTLTR